MRKYYLDFIRLLCVLLLIPFHTFMIYNNFGEGQYVPGVPLASATWIIWLIYPWFIPALFIISRHINSLFLTKTQYNAIR